MPKEIDVNVKQWRDDNKQKDKIREVMRKSDQYATNISKIKPKPIVEPLSDPEVPLKRVYTHTLLDSLFSKVGGLVEGRSIEFFGVYASGKTEVAMTLAAECGGLIIYIDSECTFDKDRFIEICKARGKDIKDVSERLLLYKPEDWMEQEAITMNLPEVDRDGKFYDVGLVVLDSLMCHWASSPEFYGRENLTTRQQLIRAEVSRLKSYVRRHHGILVYTDQVFDKPTDTGMLPVEEQLGSRGGRTVEHLGDYRILLRKGRGNVRFARLVDALDLPLMEVPFVLGDGGIEDFKDPGEKAKAVERSEKYGHKFLSGQVDSAPAGKKYLEDAVKRGFASSDALSNLTEEEKDILSDEPDEEEGEG